MKTIDQIDSLFGWPDDLRLGISLDVCRAIKEIETSMVDSLSFDGNIPKTRISHGSLRAVISEIRMLHSANAGQGGN